MNLKRTSKYGLSSEEIERRSLSSDHFKTVFNIHRIEKTQGLHDRLDDYDSKKYSAKRKKLREDLSIGEKVREQKRKVLQGSFRNSLCKI